MSPFHPPSSIHQKKGVEEEEWGCWIHVFFQCASVGSESAEELAPAGEAEGRGWYLLRNQCSLKLREQSSLAVAAARVS